MYPQSSDINPNNLRLIKTARDEQSINEAAALGFRPLVKKVVPSDKIQSKYAVFQHKKSGKIEVTSDFRGTLTEREEWEMVVNWTFYYPNKFPEPFAAYLLPSDLEVGERVWLEDLIEDYVGAVWNQGNVYRLNAAEARWTGNDLEVLYDPEKDTYNIIG